MSDPAVIRSLRPSASCDLPPPPGKTGSRQVPALASRQKLRPHAMCGHPMRIRCVPGVAPKIGRPGKPVCDRYPLAPGVAPKASVARYVYLAGGPPLFNQLAAETKTDANRIPREGGRMRTDKELAARTRKIGRGG